MGRPVNPPNKGERRWAWLGALIALKETKEDDIPNNFLKEKELKH
jgi:hypothetical protein